MQVCTAWVLAPQTRQQKQKIKFLRQYCISDTNCSMCYLVFFTRAPSTLHTLYSILSRALTHSVTESAQHLPDGPFETVSLWTFFFPLFYPILAQNNDEALLL